MNAKFYKIKSFTTPGVVYTVRRLPTGEWRCDCPYFIFQKGKKPMCDHIRKARHIKMVKHGRNALDKHK